MAVYLGKVLGNITLRQTIKVQVPKLKWDGFLRQHFRENDAILAHDPNEQCKQGDWVLIKQLKEPLSLQVKHELTKIVYENGNIIDPLTGKKCVGYDFEDDISRDAQMFGMKPITERQFDNVQEPNKAGSKR